MWVEKRERTPVESVPECNKGMGGATRGRTEIDLIWGV